MNLLENQRAAEKLDDIYIDLETKLMQNIVRHLRDYDQPIDSDEWLLKKLAEIGKLNQENLKIIAKSSSLSQTAALRMLNETSEKVLKEIEPGFQYIVREGLAGRAINPAKSENVRLVMAGLKRQAKSTLNLCNTTMLYKARDAYRNLVQATVQKANEYLALMNKGAAEVVAGVQSRQRAVRSTIKQFNDAGIPAFVDRGGRNWTPEAYVNMAMRTTAGRVADQVQEARCRDHAINLVQIDSHSGARPKCANDQGKIFDLDNGSGETEDLHGRTIRYYPWNSSSYGDPDGLLGINCGHHRWPFVPGVNVRRYFPAEDVEANNKLYQATQKQRALERAVRKQKRECMLYDQLGDKDAFKASAVKLKLKEEQLNQYVSKNDQLHRRRDREQVVGFDKRISAEAAGANKKEQKRLAEKARDDTIKSEIRAAGIKGKVDLEPAKPDVSAYTFDEVHIIKERAHNLSHEDAERLIREADVCITRWNGRFKNYYGPNGAVYVDTENRNIRTAFRSDEFDEKIKKLREVMKKRGKEN